MLSHNEVVITMIPKAGKPPDSIKAWRPITLLNVDFKIISAAISGRIQRIIGKVVDPCQTAYIKGRYIGVNTRLVFDVISSLSNKKESGVIMSADFEAAFDSLSWDFMSRVLEQYNFGPQFRNMINMLYLNPNNFSRIMLDGHLGERYI